MKKLLALTLSAILATALFAGCSNNDSTEETTSAETTTEASSEETEEELPDDIPYEAPVIESENPLTDIVNAALATGQWPVMMEVTDEGSAKDFFGIDLKNADYNNVMIVQCPMSFPFAEIIVIEAAEGKAADAEKLLSDRKAEKAADQTQYPDTIAAIEASVIGTQGNYVYYVAGTDPQAAADAIVSAITAK